MTRDVPEPDERIQIVYCVGCEVVNLPADCETDSQKRLTCPNCGAVIIPDSIWDYVDARVTNHE